MPSKRQTIENQNYRSKIVTATDRIYKNCDFTNAVIRGDLRNTEFIACTLFHTDFRNALITKTSNIHDPGQRHPLDAGARFKLDQIKTMGWTSNHKKDNHPKGPHTHWVAGKINPTRKGLSQYRRLSDPRTRSTASLTSHASHGTVHTHSSCSHYSYIDESTNPKDTSRPPSHITVSPFSR